MVNRKQSKYFFELAKPTNNHLITHLKDEIISAECIFDIGANVGCFAKGILDVGFVGRMNSDCAGIPQARPGWKDNSRRARLAADGTGLENRKGFTLLVGSNPSTSAENRISIIGFKINKVKSY
jgi:hypothetical protein